MNISFLSHIYIELSKQLSTQISAQLLMMLLIYFKAYVLKLNLSIELKSTKRKNNITRITLYYFAISPLWVNFSFKRLLLNNLLLGRFQPNLTGSICVGSYFKFAKIIELSPLRAQKGS